MAEQAAYGYWSENRSRFAAVEQALRAVPNGSCVAVTDLADVAGLRAEAVARVLYGTRPGAPQDHARVDSIRF